MKGSLLAKSEVRRKKKRDELASVDSTQSIRDYFMVLVHSMTGTQSSFMRSFSGVMRE